MVEEISKIATNVGTELLLTLISVIFYWAVAKYKEWASSSKFAIKYNLDNEIVERLLFNAVSYAEAVIKDKVHDNMSKEARAVIKKDEAFKYFNDFKPSDVHVAGDKLEKMLKRKVMQTIKRDKLLIQAKVPIQ